MEPEEARKIARNLRIPLYMRDTAGATEALAKFADRVLRDDSKIPPPILFDGFAVLQALDERAKGRTSADNVSDVLDAVVRLMRSNA
jgi:hypothetical protein